MNKTYNDFLKGLQKHKGKVLQLPSVKGEGELIKEIREELNYDAPIMDSNGKWVCSIFVF